MSFARNNHFDICVVGCGSGGFAGAMRGIDLGKHVCIVENKQIGGAGVMWGALASKSMWELAKDYHIAASTDRGYHSQGLIADYQAVRKTVFQAVREKQRQMVDQIKAYHPDNWKGPGSIVYKRGHGAFVDSHRLRISYNDGRVENVSADFFLIATGSKPRNLPDVLTDQRLIFDSDSILKLTRFPRRMLIIGAGIVGCEYATIFSNFRQTKVYLVDRAERIIPYEDEDVSAFVGSNLQKNGVTIFHSAQLQGVAKKDGYADIHLRLKDGRTETIPAEATLISIGRESNLSSLRLDQVSITPDKRGFLRVTDNCRVAGNIYAAGDVTPHPALVNLAETEARYAVKHMYGVQKWPLRYDNMSTVMFFYPPVAAVGLNEKECRERQIAYQVAYYSNRLLSRAIAMRAADGFVKIIVSDDPDQMILGMRAAGPQVSTTIMSIALLMDQDKSLKDVLKTVHPHPTMCEGIQECLRVLRNKSIYKPHAFPDLVKIRTWRPGA